MTCANENLSEKDRKTLIGIIDEEMADVPDRVDMFRYFSEFGLNFESIYDITLGATLCAIFDRFAAVHTKNNHEITEEEMEEVFWLMTMTQLPHKERIIRHTAKSEADYDEKLRQLRYRTISDQEDLR